jgi:hypothetical protein
MMSTATPDRTRIITEALRKIDDLSARLQIAEHLATLLPDLVEGADRPERADVDPYVGATEDELLQQLSERLG